MNYFSIYEKAFSLRMVNALGPSSGLAQDFVMPRFIPRTLYSSKLVPKPAPSQ
jgi:hypothetical protein